MRWQWRDLVLMLLLAAGAILAVFKLTPEPREELLPEPQPTGATDTLWMDREPPGKLYGIPVSSYRITEGRVGRNQLLSDILLPFGATMKQIHGISLLPDSLIDARRIRAGQKYTVFSTSDTTPVYFVYEKDPLNYVVIRLGEEPPFWAENGTKPVRLRIRSASGTIRTSLWEAMREERVNPMLAVELSEIFAWSIDFFGLRQGDRYKVIYEESYVDSVATGINRILAAWFYHNGAEFWGIPFIQGGRRSFFDEQGNSLRKAFLKAPLRFSRISSGFSHSRLHPVLKIRRPHHGVDYVAATGTPVHSVGDGVVLKMGYQARGGGNYVKIRHNSVYSTTYMHLHGFARGLRQGRYVKQGDVIGYVGSTGLSTGPHLDFRFYRNGGAVNPLTVEAPPVEPIAEENRASFWLVKMITLQALRYL